ncbi:MAG: hypothetical protein AAGH79_13845, partial [Bacteroidota bacterium]
AKHRESAALATPDWAAIGELLLLSKQDYEHLITKYGFWRDFMAKVMLDDFCRLTTIQQKFIQESPGNSLGNNTDPSNTHQVSLETLADILGIPREKLPIFFGQSQ